MNNINPKKLHFDEEGRNKLANGIKKIAKAVKSTLGPLGHTVLIESQEHTHGITVTKDGVTVAKSITLMDSVENLAVRMVREAASKTAANAGDGTTTAIVIAEKLILEGMDKITMEDNKTLILRELVASSEKILSNLKNKSKPVNKKKLLDVASISANNDEEVGKIIADTYNTIGKNGIVTVEKSQGSETTFETTHGIKIDRGYYSPLFINNHKKDECVLDDVHILVSDSEIGNILDIEKILKPIVNDRKKLLIVAPCSQNVINTLAANVMKNGLKLCAINPPSFGYKQHELMQDIALSVGATYFSEKTGDDLSLITFEDLGKAEKIIIGKDSSIILRDDSLVNEKEIKEREQQLWDAHKITNAKADKDFILSRIASLTGGIGVIYVGGNTDLEQKELYDRVDDAVCAVRSALEEGILPGGGLALFDEGQKILETDAKSNAKKIANAILSSALKEPLKQIYRNAGHLYIDDEGYADQNIHPRIGVNMKNGETGDMLKMGIIDPVKVTRQALKNAISVAVTILSTNAIVTMARTYEENK
jgi:chaperonin GroEL